MSKGANTRRTYSRVFYVSNGSVSVRVCKTAFLRIHAVSNGRLNRALKAQQDAGGSPHQDQRGRHEPANKTKAEDIAAVSAHIKRFPKYKSHYSRSDSPHKEYLSPDLSIAKMYAIYKEEIEAPVSEWVYRKVFNENFNLSFGR